MENFILFLALNIVHTRYLFTESDAPVRVSEILKYGKVLSSARNKARPARGGILALAIAGHLLACGYISIDADAHMDKLRCLLQTLNLRNSYPIQSHFRFMRERVLVG